MWRKWLLTFGGSGLCPVAPGTAGSLAAALLLLAIHRLAFGGAPSSLAWNVVLVALVVASGFICVTLGPWAVRYFGRKDPGSVVIDEVAGLCVAAIGLPLLPVWREAWLLLGAFLAFRLFDVTKPPPCRQLERLPLGWGILCDDLAAGIYANLVCQLVFRFAL